MSKRWIRLSEDAVMIAMSINNVLDDYFIMQASSSTYSSSDFSEGRVFFSKEFGDDNKVSFSISLNLDSKKDKEDICWVRYDKTLKKWHYEDLHPFFDERIESLCVVIMEKLYYEVSNSVVDKREDFHNAVDELLKKASKTRGIMIPNNVTPKYSSNVDIKKLREELKDELREELQAGMLVLQSGLNDLQTDVINLHNSKPTIRRIVSVK